MAKITCFLRDGVDPQLLFHKNRWFADAALLQPICKILQEFRASLPSMYVFILDGIVLFQSPGRLRILEITKKTIKIGKQERPYCSIKETDIAVKRLKNKGSVT